MTTRGKLTEAPKGLEPVRRKPESEIEDDCDLPLYEGSWLLASQHEPPKDGTHILVCCGPYDQHWGFNQRPPAVVHYYNNPGEEGFYLSNGAREDDDPFEFTHWQPLEQIPLYESCSGATS